MAMGRFASITSDLLARKGEARPWGQDRTADRMAEPEKPALRWRQELSAQPVHVTPVIELPPLEPPFAAEEPQAASDGEPPPPFVGGSRKCTLRLSAHDYERLGIIAVKLDTSRHHLLQQAVARFLSEQERLYRKECRCMAASQPLCATPCR